ncbi:MAG TPA: hypothetical protein VNQ52_01980 [Microbacteriaceae bacterium]|nr:hypothetical protein [Microbacteriaceae bacterium]
MARNARRSALLGLAALVVLAGCAPGGAGPMNGPELLLQAKAHNLRFKAAVAVVQTHLYSGAWSSGGDYGAVPGDWLDCGEGEYQFALSRMGPIGVVPPIEPAVLADRLRIDGWREISIREFPGISDDVVVTAQKPSAAVIRLIVTFYEHPQGVSVAADSTCAPGDAWEILQLMEGASGELPAYPQTEAPGDVPLFESGG